MGLAHYDRMRIKQESSNLFVKGLGNDDTNMSLYNLFKVYGEIFSSKLCQDVNGKSKGFGFVQYTSSETAQKVIAEANGKEYQNRKLLVAPYKKRDRALQIPVTNLYIKNLPGTITTKENLDKLFEPFGERISVGLGQSSFNGKTGYFGFVCFKEPSAASNALKEMNGKILDGSSLIVTKALNKEQREREKRKLLVEYREKVRRRTLYVKSITGAPLEEQKVHDELTSYGHIVKVTINMLKDEKGNPTGSPVGFVIFEKEEYLQRALTEYVGENRNLVISRLERKEDRRARLAKERSQRKRNISMHPPQPEQGLGRGRNVLLEDFYRQVYRHLNDGPRMLGEFLLARRYTNYVLGVGQREVGGRPHMAYPYGYMGRAPGYGIPRPYA